MCRGDILVNESGSDTWSLKDCIFLTRGSLVACLEIFGTSATSGASKL